MLGVMRRLLPPPDLDVEPAELVIAEDRTPPPGRPWVALNMVASADGAIAAPDGRSGPLSGSADRALFHALRGEADVVLAGASTVRVESYGPPRLPDETRARRREAGRSPLPRLAVATASLQLDPASRFFRAAQDAGQPPIVLTSQDALEAHPHAAAALEPVAALLTAGNTVVEWPLAMEVLRDMGAGVVLVEGGPSLNGQLLEADLVDELCLTVSPLLVGGSGPKVFTGPLIDEPRQLRLARVAEDDGFLLLRYVRATG